jgi:hypothetical protein
MGFNYRVEIIVTGFFTDFTLSGYSYSKIAALLHCSAAK